MTWENFKVWIVRRKGNWMKFELEALCRFQALMKVSLKKYYISTYIEKDRFRRTIYFWWAMVLETISKRNSLEKKQALSLHNEVAGLLCKIPKMLLNLLAQYCFFFLLGKNRFLPQMGCFRIFFLFFKKATTIIFLRAFNSVK